MTFLLVSLLSVVAVAVATVITCYHHSSVDFIFVGLAGLAVAIINAVALLVFVDGAGACWHWCCYCCSCCC